jgi:hypothetical protein
VGLGEPGTDHLIDRLGPLRVFQIGAGKAFIDVRHFFAVRGFASEAVNWGSATRAYLKKLRMVYRESSNSVRAFLTSFSNTSYDSVFWLMVCSLPPHRVELRFFQRII